MVQEKDNTIKLSHNIIMEDRKALTISGVNDVDSFDESIIVLFTELGELTIKGESLHIEKLNVETGDVHLTGTVIALVYNDEPVSHSKASLFKRMFK